MSEFDYFVDFDELNKIPKTDFGFTPLDSIPPSCRSCNNHPSNGGSGICFCILGLPEITC